MERITISMDADLLSQLDSYMEASRASNRSDALRDLVRRGLNADSAPREDDCIAVISYAMDPTQRDLGRRIPQSRHERHDSAIAALSVPLDHAAAVEVAVMRGKVGALTDYAHSLFLERGILHGDVSYIPVRHVTEVHAHGTATAHSHDHLRIRASF